MKRKITKAIEVTPRNVKEWCGYCGQKSRARRNELEEKEFEFWECKKCRLIDEYRK